MSSYSTEVWKEIPGYEGLYLVSNFGRLETLGRVVVDKVKGTTRTRAFKRKFLKPSPSSGYMLIWLHKDKISKKFAVHRLVLEAFVGPAPEGMEGCHNDGNWKNNHLENLRWGTHKSNHEDRIQHGTNNFGENNGAVKLEKEDVLKIREFWESKRYFQRELAEMFGVSQGQIMRIVTRKNWRHV